MTKRDIRDGFSTVTPYLFISNIESLFVFMKQAFNAIETYRSLNEKGSVKHAEFRIGNSMIMAAEASNPEMAMPCNLHLYIDNLEQFYNQAIESGGTSIMEPNQQPYGEKIAGVKDPTGNIWWMASPISSI